MIIYRHTVIDYGPDTLAAPIAILTTTHVLKLPINCVLDGQQREPLSKLMGLDGAITGPMRGIFKE